MSGIDGTARLFVGGVVSNSFAALDVGLAVTSLNATKRYKIAFAALHLRRMRVFTLYMSA